MKRKMKRAVHFDFHNLPALPDLGDDFSAEKYVAMLREAKVKYINFFARCNLGFSYYPTKLGTVHPYLKGRDILGDMIKECHKYDIGISAYINGGLNHELADKKREWTTVNKDGQILFGDRTGNCFRTMCYDTGYGDYLVDEVKEILTLYPDVDGIFIDCFTFPGPCFGHECMEHMKEENIDIDNQNALIKYNEGKILRMAKRLRDVVPSDKYFFINGSNSNNTCYPGRTSMDTHAEIECLATGGWGYEFFPYKVAYDRNVFKDTIFMTGRFHQTWGDFGGLREKAGLEYDAFFALANAVDISIGDHLPPRGLPEKAVFKTIKEVYTEVEKVEPWTDDAKYVSEIGVYMPKGDWSAFRESKEYPIVKATDALQGVCRMLCELKYQYDVITDESDFSPYRLLVLPDCMTLPDSVTQKMQAYIKNGGKVISSGNSALKTDLSDFALPEWNFDYKGEDSLNVSYFKARDEIAKDIPDMPIAAYRPGVMIAPKDGNTVLADYWEPYFDKHWDGYHGYYYTPYSKKSETLASVVQEGSVIHIAFDIFGAYKEHQYPNHRKLFANCMERLLPEKRIKSSLPVFARATLTEKDNTTLLHVLAYCPEVKNQIGIIDEGMKLYENSFSIESDKAPRIIYSVPEREKVDFKYENGRINFDIYKIDSHAIFAIEF